MRPLHRLPRNNWLLVCIVLSDCAATVRPSIPEPRQSSPAATGSGQQGRAQTADLQLHIDRIYKGQQAVGLAVLKPPLTVEGLRAKHEKLAGARAWLSLAAQRGQLEDWSGTVECAQAGWRELGELRHVYPRLGLLDHSGMHWRDAEDEIKQGRVKEAAAVMLRILKLRTDLYVRYYEEEIAE